MTATAVLKQMLKMLCRIPDYPIDSYVLVSTLSLTIVLAFLARH